MRLHFELAIALALTAAPAAAAAAEDGADVPEIGHALYDLCPRLLRAELTPNDAAMREMGYRAIAPLGSLPRWQHGSGDATVVFGGNGHLCVVAFGGRHNQSLFERTSDAALAHGFVEQPLSDPRLRSGVRNYQRAVEGGAQPWLLSFIGVSSIAGVDLRPMTFAAMTNSERQ